MADALVTSVQTMQAHLRQLERISQNVANAATPGYKATRLAGPAFATVLAAGATAAEPVESSAGALRQTGRALDLALDGGGWFEVGLADGPAYTRAGNFRLDPSGRLVTHDGRPVAAADGALVAAGPQLEIRSDGSVWQHGRRLGSLRIVQFPPGTELVRAGSGVVRPAAPTTPAAAAPGQVRSGFLEQSNVDSVDQMTQLVRAVRQYEAAQRLFQMSSEQLGGAITQLSQ